MFSYANASKTQINIKTGFLHITCDDIRSFKKFDDFYHFDPNIHPKKHLYLNGKNFDELSKIMETHGKEMFKGCGYDPSYTDISPSTYTPNKSGDNFHITWGIADDSFNLNGANNYLRISLNILIQNHLPEIIRHIFMMFHNNTAYELISSMMIHNEYVPKTNIDYVHISLDYFKDTSEHNIRYTQSDNIKRSYKFYMEDSSSQTRGRSGHTGTPRSGSRPHSAMLVDPSVPSYTSRPPTASSGSRPHSATYIDPSRDTSRPLIPRFDISRTDISGVTYRAIGDDRSGDRSGVTYRATYYDRDRMRDTRGYSGDYRSRSPARR